MKLVFDDGTEQKIIQEDFYGILIRAEKMSEERRLDYLDDVNDPINDGQYEVAMQYLKMADREKSINTVCQTIERLYFS